MLSKLKPNFLHNKNSIMIVFAAVFGVVGYISLRDSRAAISADFNSDGIVNVLDLSILATNYTKSDVRLAQGDANGDGLVNVLDLSILATQWNTNPGGDVTPPSAPSGLTATASSSSQIALSWTGSSDNVLVSKYIVYRDGIQIGEVVAPNTSYLDTGLSAGTTYTYSVKASDAAANLSSSSNVASTTTQSSSGGSGSNIGPYLSTNGSDSNSCSSVSPCRTFAKAFTVANPGETITVKAGVYTAPVVLSKSNLTIRSETKWGAVIDGQNSVADGFVFGTGVSNITIDGFEIKNLRSMGGSSSGIELFNGGTGSVIKNNNIHDIGVVCTSTSNGQVAIFVAVSNVTISDNYIHDLGRLQPSEGCAVGDPTHDHGIYLNATKTTHSDVSVSGNYFFNIKRGWAIQMYPGAWQNSTISKNIFSGGNLDRQNASIVIYDMSLSSVNFTNNTFYSPTSACRPFTLGGTLTFSSVSVNSNITSCIGLTDIAPPPGWNATSNTLNSNISAPLAPS